MALDSIPERQEMTLEAFASDYKLRVKIDDCRDKYIPAKFGQIFCDDGQMAVMFIDDPQGSHRNTIRSRMRKGIAAGMVASQMGDGEGVLRFGPEGAKLAIKLVGARRSKKGQGAGKKPTGFIKTQAQPQPLAVESTSAPK